MATGLKKSKISSSIGTNCRKAKTASMFEKSGWTWKENICVSLSSDTRITGPCLAKMYLWAYADSQGPDQTSQMHRLNPQRLIRAVIALSTNKIIGYYKMYEWRSNP